MAILWNRNDPSHMGRFLRVETQNESMTADTPAAAEPVLILGGGDGLAAREILRYPSVETVVLVDLDPAITKAFQTLPLALKLNDGALNNPRVTVLNQDAFLFLDEHQGHFDLTVVDFPDPGNYSLGKLYTVSFYEKLRERIGMRGVVVVQSTSPYFARQSFWSINATMKQAGFTTLPMHVYVASFGEWGYVIGGGKGLRQPTQLRLPPKQLKFLDATSMAQLFSFPRDMSAVDAPVNRLSEQKLVRLYNKEWAKWAP